MAGRVELTEAELRILAKYPEPKRRPKPKPTVTLAVEPDQLAEVKARPEGVRLVTTREDGVTGVRRVRPTEGVEVVAVDDQARPLRMKVTDFSTGDVGYVECVNGYRPAPGAQHEYNPMDALRRRGDE